MSLRIWIVLEIGQWASARTISTRVRTIRGYYLRASFIYFAQSSGLCCYYSRAVSTQRTIISFHCMLGWARSTYVYKPSFPDVLYLLVDGWHQFFDKGLLDVAQNLVCSHHKLLLHSWHKQHTIIRHGLWKRVVYLINIKRVSSFPLKVSLWIYFSLIQHMPLCIFAQNCLTLTWEGSQLYKHNLPIGLTE